MSLSHLSVQGVRNLNAISLNFTSSYNFFIGPNGSGKTSLLEAIYLLGTSRSFRTHLYSKVVQHGASRLAVFGALEEDIFLGVQKEKDGDTKIRINHQACNHSASLAQHLPLQLYHADSFGIIDASPKTRRELLDWGVFHHEPEYFKVWAYYQRILKQRNAWLREVRRGQSPWDKLLSEYAEKIHQLRWQYFQLFLPVFHQIKETLMPLERQEFSIRYFKGWREEAENLFICLEEDKERDLRMGYTHHGPHKADILLQELGILVKDTYSRGQQKLLILCIKLAQGVLLSQTLGKSCVYLLDDLSAEFDSQHFESIMEYLTQIPGQFFFTGVNADTFTSCKAFQSGQMFHVKQGEVC